jgi:hypothetical protein
MDKQKQVEEMANVMLSNMERPKCFTSATEEQEFLNAYKLSFIGYATHLYNAGCRIINENAVVLTREEYDDMFTFETVGSGGKHCGFYNILDTVRKVERKETVEKFALKLADYFVEHCSGKLSISLTLQEWYKMIDEIVKELTGNREELTEGK